MLTATDTASSFESAQEPSPECQIIRVSSYEIFSYKIVKPFAWAEAAIQRGRNVINSLADYFSERASRRIGVWMRWIKGFINFIEK